MCKNTAWKNTLYIYCNRYDFLPQEIVVISSKAWFIKVDDLSIGGTGNHFKKCPKQWMTWSPIDLWAGKLKRQQMCTSTRWHRLTMNCDSWQPASSVDTQIFIWLTHTHTQAGFSCQPHLETQVHRSVGLVYKASFPHIITSPFAMMTSRFVMLMEMMMSLLDISWW